jgi:hypothetical protein
MIGETMLESKDLLIVLLKNEPEAAETAFIVLNRGMGAPHDVSSVRLPVRNALEVALGSTLDRYARPLLSAVVAAEGELADVVRGVLKTASATSRRSAGDALMEAARVNVNPNSLPPRLRLLLGEAARASRS